VIGEKLQTDCKAGLLNFGDLQPKPTPSCRALPTLQTAQPVTLAIHLLAWYGNVGGDGVRLQDCRKAGERHAPALRALAGTTYPIGPRLTPKLPRF